MAQSVTLYNLLISCPSDITDEVALIESEVERFNEFYANPLGITIKTRHWSTSSYAQSGGKPQALLNEQFVNDCDAVVAIFWTKFGSPTEQYGSGTEEEIETFLKSGKQVFMYFSDKPISPSEMNNDGYTKIKEFRDKYKEQGLYFTYSSNEEFKNLFFAHLSMYFLTDKKLKETTADRVSELKLMGIDENGKLSEEASVYPFMLNTKTTIRQFIDTIRSMFHEIEEMNVGKREHVDNTIFWALKSPIEIDNDERKYIEAVAKQLKLELSENFFDLGNLSEDTFTSYSLSSHNLNGTPDEIQKYKSIKELHETISKTLEWAPVEKAFSEKHCLRLAIQNCGKAIDEDVEITFEIPRNELLTLNEFPQFSNNEMGYLLNDCDMSVLFGIDSTAEYVEYSESERNRHNVTPRPIAFNGYVPDYSETFNTELSNIFCYSVYPQGDNYIVKLKVDYIKHNTAVAFPTILFITDYVEKITYKITSKNNPNIIEGVLKVKKLKLVT